MVPQPTIFGPFLSRNGLFAREAKPHGCEGDGNGQLSYRRRTRWMCPRWMYQ